MMKRLLLSFAMLMATSQIMLAIDFIANGFYFRVNADGETVTVTSTSYNDDFTPYSGHLNIPATVAHDGKTYTVTEIGTLTYDSDNNITGVTIPNTVHTIQQFAFQQCKITELFIPASVTTIGRSAFALCTNLKRVITPSLKDWMNINFWASTSDTSNPLFYAEHLYVGGHDDATELINVIIPEGTEEIKPGTFAGAKYIESVSFPSSLKKVGVAAFDISNPALKTIYATSIEAWCKIDFDQAFSNLLSSWFAISNPMALDAKLCLADGNPITNLHIPEGLVRIGESTFAGGKQFKIISLPSTLREVGISAFAGCDGTNRLYITSLEDYLKINFANLYSNPVYIINGWDRACWLSDDEATDHIIDDLVIPEGTTEVDSFAFCNLGYIHSITIPASVTKIGKQSFYHLSAHYQGSNTITIKGHLTEVGSEAFGSNFNYMKVRCYDTNPAPIPDDAFINRFNLGYPDYRKADQVYLYATLYVPECCKERYQNTDGWKLFQKIEEDSSLSVDAVTVSPSTIYFT